MTDEDRCGDKEVMKAKISKKTQFLLEEFNGRLSKSTWGVNLMKNKKRHWVIGFIVAVAFAIVCPLGFAIELEKPVVPISPDKLKKPIGIPKCADLEATLMMSKTISGRNGIINLTAKVCNVGTADYASPPMAPAHASLAGYDPGRPLTRDNYQVIAGKDITNLVRGACTVFTGSYTIPLVIQWGRRTASPGECQAEKEFSLSIGRNVPDDIVWRPGEDCKTTNNLSKQRVKYMVECPW